MSDQRPRSAPPDAPEILILRLERCLESLRATAEACMEAMRAPRRPGVSNDQAVDNYCRLSRKVRAIVTLELRTEEALRALRASAAAEREELEARDAAARRRAPLPYRGATVH